MRKLLLVAFREVRQKVKQRGYLITTIALPIILLAVGLLTDRVGTDEIEPIETPQANGRTLAEIGYVDHANLIQTIPENTPARLSEYPDVQAAQEALRAGEIVAYYEISEDYRQSGQVERVSLELNPDPGDTRSFEWLLIHNLNPDLDGEQVSRLRWPFNAQGLQTINPDSQDSAPTPGSSMIPYFVGILVMMPLFTSGSYLFQSLTQEKSNRVLEILLVSLRPRQMLSGKVLGYGILVILQYVIWAVLGGLAALLTGGEVFNILAGVDISRSELIWILPFAMGGFLLYAGIMAGFGALAKDIESNRIWIFIISLPMFIPFYLGSAISQAPNGPLSVILSMIPFSAPVAMMLRLTTTSVPFWQLATSVVLLLALGIGMIALMARIFKAQTLLSGEELSVKKFIAALA